jgi:lipopolysaccharide transport system permease protein
MPPSPPADRRPRAERLRIDSRRRWFPDLRETLRAWQLLLLLGRRDITVSYRQTVLGAVWIFISPALSAGLFTFVFSGVAHLSSGGVPYFAFSYAGLLAWNLFADTLTGASGSLTSSSSLITKIYFPRLVLPIASLASTLIETAISFAVMVLLLVIYHIGFSARLLVLPLWLLLGMLLAMGAGLVLTAISVTYRDINKLTPAVIPLFLYLTPVAYSSSVVPHKLRAIYLLNPVATVVNGCRWSLVGHIQIPLWTVAYTVVWAVAAMLIGLALFARLEWSFADVI